MATVSRRRGKWVADYRDGAGRRHWETYETRRAAEDAPWFVAQRSKIEHCLLANSAWRPLHLASLSTTEHYETRKSPATAWSDAAAALAISSEIG